MDDKDLDRLIDALAPGVLDWTSGVVVPLLLGGATLVVAIWAGRIARRSNGLLEQQHRETAQGESRRRRAVFADFLVQMSSSITAARLAGMDPTNDLLQLEKLQALSRAAAESDEPSSRLLTSWVSQVSRHRPLPDKDVDAWMKLNADVRTMLDAWVADPAAASSLIESDAEYQSYKDRESSPGAEED